MKQFMVVKMIATGVKGALSVVPLLALVPLQAAEEAVRKFTKEDPDGVFLIQEVGHT
jgi:hypothetical protein